jgi:ABC-2 type transport system ATP-binding protein
VVAQISIRGLAQSFGEVRALDGIDLDVEGPGVFGLLGVNGAGKTTLMRILNGFLVATEGEARLFGEPVGPAAEGVRRRIGYLPQYPAFYKWMRAEEYLSFVGDLFGLPRRESKQVVARLLDQVGLGEAARRKIGGFSGGMKQRLGIAQALMGGPELLLLDEPVSALDPVGRKDVLELIEELGRTATVFMSSHILEDIQRVCERVAIVSKGRVVVDERTETLLERYARSSLLLVVRGEGGALRDRLRSEPWAEAVTAQEQTDGHALLQIDVTDVDVAGAAIPGVLAEAGASLVRFGTTDPTLEDVFMRIVGGSSS